MLTQNGHIGGQPLSKVARLNLEIVVWILSYSSGIHFKSIRQKGRFTELWDSPTEGAGAMGSVSCHHQRGSQGQHHSLRLSTGLLIIPNHRFLVLPTRGKDPLSLVPNWKIPREGSSGPVWVTSPTPVPWPAMDALVHCLLCNLTGGWMKGRDSSQKKWECCRHKGEK